MSNSDPNQLPPTEDFPSVDPKRNNTNPVSEYPIVPPTKSGWPILLGFVLVIVLIVGGIAWAVYGYKPKTQVGSVEPMPQSVIVSAKKEFRCGDFATNDCTHVKISDLPKASNAEISSEKTGPVLDCSKAVKPIMDEGVLVALNVCDCPCK